jgi:toxin ParE1/3/4
MASYRVSQDAERDLEEIFVYWAERASLAAADRLIEAIVNRFWLLGEYPDSGKPSDDIARGVKCFPAGKYLIYYRAAAKGVDILHIFHGARDQKRAFKRSRKSEST